MWRIVLLATVCMMLFPLTLTAGDWQLVWSDEFNEPGLPSPERWGSEEGFVRNNELQCYTRARRENARVENGQLILETRKERYKNPHFDPAASGGSRRRTQEYADYTSASLITRNIASWQYGRVEVSAKLPTGKGFWPAIWMLGMDREKVGWPACGEIDIMENVGFDPDTIHGTVHTAKYNHTKNTQRGGKITIKRPFAGFHVYSVEWSADLVQFFVDGQRYFEFKNEKTGKDAWPFDQPMYLILNVAFGGGWGGQQGVDDSNMPQSMQIDYVRVYQQAGSSR